MVNIINNANLFAYQADMYVVPIDRSYNIVEEYAQDVSTLFPDAFNILQSGRSGKPFITNHDGFFSAYDKSSGAHLCFFPTEGWGNKLSRIITLLNDLATAIKEDSGDISNKVFNVPCFGLTASDFEFNVKPVLMDLFGQESFTINLFEPNG